MAVMAAPRDDGELSPRSFTNRAMDSTDAPKSKRRHCGFDSGADLISDLTDDVLLHVLGFLPDARDAVRTGALSRRWRNLWTRAPALRFVVGPNPKPGNGLQYISFVGGVLARREKHINSGIDELVISLRIDHPPMPPYVRAITSYFSDCIEDVPVGSWLRYGMLHAVKTFVLHLPSLRRNRKAQAGEAQEPAAVELPTSARPETMRLALGGAVLNLPTTAAFDSLTDLSLEDIRFAAGIGQHLGRLLSSTCCPRLRKLRLFALAGLTELQLEANALSELSLSLLDLRLLELRTPSLRVLHIAFCFALSSGTAGRPVATIMAPRLEELSFSCTQGMVELNVEDSSCVRRLVKLHLWSHGETVCDNRFSICLLNLFTFISHLQVFLHIPTRKEFPDADLMEHIPQLPHVTALSVQVDVDSPGRDDFAASVATLLARCSNLTYLDLKLTGAHKSAVPRPSSEPDAFNGRYQSWKYHPVISPDLERLREVKIVGFQGRETEISLVRLLQARAPALQKLTLTLSQLCPPNKSGEDWEDLLRRCVPFATGKWTACSHERTTTYQRTPML